MRIHIDPSSCDSYREFLAVKRLPSYRVVGRTAHVPDEYVHLLGRTAQTSDAGEPDLIPALFDFQRDIVRMALRKQKFAVFADCGLGKTLIMLEYARCVLATLAPHEVVLIVSPLMVVPQTIAEAKRFYGDTLEMEQVAARDLPGRLGIGRGGIVITNYDALTDNVRRGSVRALILDESSMLKSHYGAWGTHCIRLGAGLSWKLCLTGTPAPNDRIEYANHAVLLDAYPTVNSFLARYFVNRGQTSERWVLKAHALEPFYRDLSHWCIFLVDPSTYGWRDGCDCVPPVAVHVEPVDLTVEQQELVFERTGTLFANNIGGIKSRSVLSQIAKGSHRGVRIASNKPGAIREMVDSWPCESTIIWCKFNAEQSRIEEEFPEAVSIRGSTPPVDRLAGIEEFKAGRVRVLISKPRILGFGLNLQVATRQVFSGLQDSYEEFYQAVKRSNRIGSTRVLNVHIPVTDIERPMVDTVLRKAHRVQLDTEEQERIFRKASHESRK